MVDIPKKELIQKLVEYSPFYIGDVVTKLNPSLDEEGRIRLSKRIYNLLKYYHPDNWVSREVAEGRKGRPRKIWTYIGERSEV